MKGKYFKRTSAAGDAFWLLPDWQTGLGRKPLNAYI
jgi:hypothetical protein